MNNPFVVGREAPVELDEMCAGRNWDEMPCPLDYLLYGVRGHPIPDEATAERLFNSFIKYKRMEKWFKADVSGTPGIEEHVGTANKLFFIHSDGKKSKLVSKAHKWFQTRDEAVTYVREHYAREVQAAKSRLATLEGYLAQARNL